MTIVLSSRANVKEAKFGNSVIISKPSHVCIKRGALNCRNSFFGPLGGQHWSPYLPQINQSPKKAQQQKGGALPRRPRNCVTHTVLSNKFNVLYVKKVEIYCC